jgi:hypothetical protein
MRPWRGQTILIERESDDAATKLLFLVLRQAAKT